MLERACWLFFGAAAGCLLPVVACWAGQQCFADQAGSSAAPPHGQLPHSTVCAQPNAFPAFPSLTALHHATMLRAAGVLASRGTARAAGAALPTQLAPTSAAAYSVLGLKDVAAAAASQLAQAARGWRLQRPPLGCPLGRATPGRQRLRQWATEMHLLYLPARI